jgi:hypothetical protein
MGFELNNCDCAVFIEDKKKEANQAISSYNSTIADCNELIKQLEPMRDKYKEGKVKVYDGEIDKNFKARRINDFIKELEKRKEQASTDRIKEEKYLETYNEYDTRK